MYASCGQGVQIQLDELIAQIFWNGIKNKGMKQNIITKLNNSKRILNTNNALDVIKNSKVGKKATRTTNKKVAAAPKKDKRRREHDKKCNYCYKVGHVENTCFNKLGEKFNPEGTKPRPEKHKGWLDYKERIQKKVAATR